MKSIWVKNRGRKWQRRLVWFLMGAAPVAAVIDIIRGNYLDLCILLVVFPVFLYLTFTTKLPVWLWRTNRFINGSRLMKLSQGKRYPGMWAEFAEEWKERFGEDI